MQSYIFLFSRFFCIYLFVLPAIGFSQSKIESHNQMDFNFAIDYNLVSTNSFQYYIAFLDRKKEKLNIKTHQFNLPIDYNKTFSKLDIYNDWNKRNSNKELPYLTNVMKTVYVVNKNISFFTRSKVTNLEYIKSVLPSYTITKKDNNTFHLDSGKISLAFDFNVHYYSRNSKNKTYLSMKQYVIKNTPNLPNVNPNAMVIQYNYNYNKVLFFDTCKASVVVQAYYKYNEKETLIVSYTLSYINNLPPEIMGGGKMTLENILRNINNLIYFSNIK